MPASERYRWLDERLPIEPEIEAEEEAEPESD